MFFKRLFKKPPPPEPVVEKLGLDAIRERVDSLRKERLETIGPTFNTVADEIIRTRETLLNDLKILADANPSENVYAGLLKTSIEAKKLLKEKITRALTNIKHRPELSTNALEAFDEKLTKTTNLTTDAMVIHGRYVRTTFGPEFTSVQFNLRRLHDVSKQLHTTIGEILRESRRLDSLSSEIDSQVELMGYVTQFQDDAKSLENFSKETEEKVKNDRERLTKLRSSEEFKRTVDAKQKFKQTELEIDRVKGEVRSAFSDIGRPLRKFEKLVSSGKHQIDREKIKALELCVNNPLELISSDEKISVAEELLRETVKLLDERKIELDERERRKKLERTQKLATKLREFKKRLELLDQQLEVQRQASEHPIQKQVSELEQSIARHEAELNQMKMSIGELDRKSKLTQEEIEEKRVKLKKLASEILGTKVELTF